ncbi:MAG: LysR family transcriptional regulator [Pseudomonadota bacterium]
MDRIDSLRAFTQVIEHGSFAAAARALDLSRSVVNKAVIKLESQLQTQLLTRSTRRVTPTEAGLAFYDRCISIVTEFDDAIDAMTSLHDRPSGTLRVNAPMSFGTLHLSPLVAEFMQTHETINIELVLNDRLVDPIEEGFDLSIRIAELTYPTSLINLPIAPAKRVLCVSETFTARHGNPTSAEQLRELPCLQYGYSGTAHHWRLKHNDVDKNFPIRCRMWSNNGEVLKRAAMAGQGIALLPTFIVGRELQSGQLQSVLHDFAPTDLTLSALYPRHKHLSTKVRLFVELLKARYGETPYWDLVS